MSEILPDDVMGLIFAEMPWMLGSICVKYYENMVMAASKYHLLYVTPRFGPYKIITEPSSPDPKFGVAKSYVVLDKCGGPTPYLRDYGWCKNCGGTSCGREWCSAHNVIMSSYLCGGKYYFERVSPINHPESSAILSLRVPFDGKKIDLSDDAKIKLRVAGTCVPADYTYTKDDRTVCYSREELIKYTLGHVGFYSPALLLMYAKKFGM